MLLVAVNSQHDLMPSCAGYFFYDVPHLAVADEYDLQCLHSLVSLLGFFFRGIHNGTSWNIRILSFANTGRGYHYHGQNQNH